MNTSYIEVLLAEYRAIKDEQRSRTALQVQLLGFVFVAATVAATLLEPVLSNPRNSVLLLAISIGFSLIGFLYLSLSRFLQALIQYEYTELRPKIQRYLEATQDPNDPSYEMVILWWAWYRTQLRRESFLMKIVKASTLYTPLVFALGLAILFLYYQGGNLLQLSAVEWIFLLSATILIAIYVVSIVSDMRAYRFFEVPSDGVILFSHDHNLRRHQQQRQ